MSRIDRITIHAFDWVVEGMGSVMRAAPGGRVNLQKFALTIETDDGLRGEYVPHYMGRPMTMAQVQEMAPMLIGRDPETRGKIFDDLRNAFRHYDGAGIAALDAALWDMAGRKAGLSIAKMLGGWRTRLPAYASTHPGQTVPGGLDSVEAFAEFAAYCAELGYPAFKIHAFWDGTAKREIEVMAAVKARVGERMKLMTDPASSLANFVDAVEVGRACDDLGFYWYEDPFRDNSASAFAQKRLREMIKTPLIVSEHVRGLEQKANFLLAGGTDILHIDPELDGGITGTMKLAAFAECLGMDVQLHTAGPLHRHCMAAIRNTHFYEMGLVGPGMVNTLAPPVYTCGYGDQLEDIAADGTVSVPEGPGMGVAYDWDWIKARETARHEIR